MTWLLGNCYLSLNMHLLDHGFRCTLNSIIVALKAGTDILVRFLDKHIQNIWKFSEFLKGEQKYWVEEESSPAWEIFLKKSSNAVSHEKRL